MAATKIGIIFGTKNKHVRRIIKPDDDSELLTLLVGPGESLETVPIDTPLDHQTLSELIGTHPDPNAARCAVVNPSGDVVQVLMADPEIDSVDNHAGLKSHTLVAHPHADVGWVYNHQTKIMRKP